jgi:hypothetical protein
MGACRLNKYWNHKAAKLMIYKGGFSQQKHATYFAKRRAVVSQPRLSHLFVFFHGGWSDISREIGLDPVLARGGPKV